jgi:hypothetical protein
MEQTIAFGLGVLMVLAVAGVITMFKSLRKNKIMEDDISGILLEMIDLEKNIHTRIDEVYDRIDNEIIRLDRREEDMFKYIDSRTDKLESRIDSRFNDNTAFVDGLYHSIDAIKSKIKSKIK